MKKFLLFVGAIVGFVFGSRAGRRPYELLETKARKLARRSDVQHAVDHTKWAVKDKVDETTTAIRDRADGVAQNVEDLTAALGDAEGERSPT